MREIKNHTLQKLKYFEKYLEAYLLATKKLPKKYYIDAFAGTGKCILCQEDTEIRGSALVALQAKNSFDGYILIEKDPKNLKELKKSIEESNIPKDRLNKMVISSEEKGANRDSNEILKNLHKVIPFGAGCFIFLDPEGPELFWDTIEVLSKIQKADIFILYPYDMALVRLTKDYKEKLNKFYGNSEWEKLYNSRINPQDARNKLLYYYVDNLKKLGFGHVVYRQIKTALRSGHPLYHLILASHHPVAAKIMQQIFDKELDGQQRLL